MKVKFAPVHMIQDLIGWYDVRGHRKAHYVTHYVEPNVYRTLCGLIIFSSAASRPSIHTHCRICVDTKENAENDHAQDKD